MDKFLQLRLWGMYVVSLLAIGFTVYSTRQREKLEKIKDKFLIRKLYWCLWIVISTITINHAKAITIYEYGKNPLGISATIWVLGYMFVVGCLIYYLLVSNKTIKSISKDFVEFESTKENVNATLEEAKIKSLATYTSTNDVVSYAYYICPTMYGETHYDYLEIIKNVVNIFMRKQVYLSLSFVCVVDDLPSVRAKEADKAIKSLEEAICYDTTIEDDQHLIFMPFESAFCEPLIVIGVTSEKPFVGLEQYQILGLLELFEEVILAINEN